jgi:hypothetical protein
MNDSAAYMLFMRTASTPDGSPYLIDIRPSNRLDVAAIRRWMSASPDVRARVVAFPSGTTAPRVREAMRLLSAGERRRLYAMMRR